MPSNSLLRHSFVRDLFKLERRTDRAQERLRVYTRALCVMFRQVETRKSPREARVETPPYSSVQVSGIH